MARLTFKDRQRFAAMYEAETPIHAAAAKLGCSPQTLYAELYRGSTGGYDERGRKIYDPTLGQRRVQEHLREGAAKRKAARES